MRKKFLCGMVLFVSLLTACSGSTEEKSMVEHSSVVATEVMEETVEESSTEVSTEEAEETSKYEEQVYEVVDGEVIYLDINYPEGYYLDVNSGSSFHRLYTPYGPMLQIMAAGEEEKAAYDKYVSSGEWEGTVDWAVETIVDEKTVNVPIGTVTVITGEDEKGRVTDHCFIEYENVLWYISRELLYYSDTAGSIEDVINEIFNEKELSEIVPVVEIEEVNVEIQNGQYQYSLTDNVFDKEAKVSVFMDVFGFNFGNSDFSVLSVDEWEYDGKTFINSYQFISSNNDLFRVGKTDAMNIAFLKEYLLYGTYTEDAHVNWDGAALLKGIEMGECIDTPYGPAQIVYSVWSDTINGAKEFALLNVNGVEVLISYEGWSSETPSLENYEGKLKTFLSEMF